MEPAGRLCRHAGDRPRPDLRLRHRTSQYRLVRSRDRRCRKFRAGARDARHRRHQPDAAGRRQRPSVRADQRRLDSGQGVRRAGGRPFQRHEHAYRHRRRRGAVRFRHRRFHHRSLGQIERGRRNPVRLSDGTGRRRRRLSRQPRTRWPAAFCRNRPARPEPGPRAGASDGGDRRPVASHRGGTAWRRCQLLHRRDRVVAGLAAGSRRPIDPPQRLCARWQGTRASRRADATSPAGADRDFRQQCAVHRLELLRRRRETVPAPAFHRPDAGGAVVEQGARRRRPARPHEQGDRAERRTPG